MIVILLMTERIFSMIRIVFTIPLQGMKPLFPHAYLENLHFHQQMDTRNIKKDAKKVIYSLLTQRALKQS